jgi:hypothetical protein
MFDFHTDTTKSLQIATFMLAIVEFFKTCILFHFSTDDEGVDIILHVPSSYERQTCQLRHVILISHQATRSGSSDARNTLPSVADKPPVLRADMCKATLNVTVCLLHKLHCPIFNCIL